MGAGDSDLDSDDDREKKLVFLQEQLKKMQDQLNALVEDSLRYETSATFVNNAGNIFTMDVLF